MEIFKLFGSILVKSDEADKSIQKTENKAVKFAGTLGKGITTAAKWGAGLVTAAAGAATAVVGALVQMDEKTREYRENQAKLTTAWEAAGGGAELAKQAYTGLYAVLGDQDTATEAGQLLAQLAGNAQDVATWTDIAAGVTGTFGEALPINSLIEASNETAKVGQVTGALADALNWAGISEDDFNEKLAACSTEQERNQLITDTLSQTYQGATEAFKANNEQVLAAREAQASMAEKLAGYGELFTMANDVLTLGDLQSDIDQIRAYGDALAALEERGIPEGLMDEITDLDVDDALAYADELLSMTDETYQEYMDLWQQKQDEAAKVASRFYQDDLAALQKEYVDQIPQALSGLKDQMEDLGIDSAQGLSDGFASMEGELRSGFIATLSSALAAAKEFLGIHSPSTVWRDEVGLQMARGLGVGFSDGMSAVQRQMQQAVPTLDLSAMQDLTAGLVTGLRGLTTGGAAAAAAPITLKVYLDKREIAEEIFDPLGDVSRRRGEPLGSH